MKNIDYSCYNIAFDYLKKNDSDREIKLLVDQYYYGIPVKKELYYALVNRNVVK